MTDPRTDESASKTRRILVVDDDPFVRMLAAGALSSDGFEIVEAASGHEGLALAQAQRPILIVCDIEMPGLDGYETLEALRRHPATSDVPFIFLTGREDRAAMRRGMELGADDYLTKPFNAEELRAAVRARLEKHALAVERHQHNAEQHFASVLPHELRTPLQVVLSGAELLMESDASKSDPSIAASIYRAGQRLHHLTENFLLSAELSPGRCHADGDCPHRLDEPGRLVESCAQAVLARWNRLTDLTLEVRDAPARIAEDEFHRAVTELLDNAAKFSRPGTPIRVSVERDAQSVQVTISDGGIGMNPEEIETVAAFRQFGRARREQQGVGLGLFIARRLIERHDGTLTITSQPGAGTTVVLHLRRAG